jgi:hypothetical protein
VVSSGFANQGIVEITTVGGATSAQLTVNGGALVNAVGATLESAVGVGGTRILAAAVNNQGSFLVNQPLLWQGGTGASANSGTLSISGGNLDLSFSGALTNTGSVTIASGRTWTVIGGTLNQSAGSIAGVGTLALSATTANFTTSFSNATTELTLSSAIVNGPGTLSNEVGRTLVSVSSTIAAPLVNDGLLRLRGSNAIDGGLTTSSTSTIRVEGDGTCCSATALVTTGLTNNGLVEITTVGGATSAELIVSGGALVNAADATLESAVGVGGTRTLTGAVNNQGTFLVSQPLVWQAGTGASANSGTLSVSGGNLDLILSGTFTNTGAVTIASGRTWAVNGGTLNQSAGSIGGAGTVALSSTTANFTTPFSNATTELTTVSTLVNGPGTLTNEVDRTLVATSSTIAAPLVNEGLLRIRGTSTISGTLTTTSTSTIRVEGDGACCAGALILTNGLTNNGLIDLTAVNFSTSSQIAVNAGALTNAASGTIASSIGAGGFRQITGTFTNQGTLLVNHPLTLSGTYSHADGAVLAGRSKLEIGATINAFEGDVAPG